MEKNARRQPPMMAAMCMSGGTTMFAETMFENRFSHAGELVKMGGDIRVNGRIAEVRGRGGLLGATVEARDLRGGAALVIAGLAAGDTTEISHVYHIDRGYEKIENIFTSLGADIVRV